MFPNSFVCHKEFFGVVKFAQDVQIGNQIVDTIVAISANIETTRRHFFLSEHFEEFALIVNATWNQMMKREFDISFTQFA